MTAIRTLAAFNLACLLGCGGASADRGLGADMRVSPAEFIEGAMPAATSGPPVVSVALTRNVVEAGEVDHPLRGALDPRATAAAIGLAGDRGYWIVPAGLPDVEAPDYPTFSVDLALAPEIKPGARDLVVRAVDAQDRLGPPDTQSLSVKAAPVPEGALVISLRWDTEADLDLHVVDPDGVEIWKRNINSYEPPPPGQPADPTAWQSGGMLDIDSNAACVIDGRRRENVIWAKTPPSGHYLVRVDTFSLCAEPSAHWVVEAWIAGKSSGRAEGTSGVIDTELPHDRGAGVLALELDVP